MVDTMGMLLAVKVHEADLQDNEGACLVFSELQGELPRLKVIWADLGYKEIAAGDAEYFLNTELVVKSNEKYDVGPDGILIKKKGFHVIQWRWIVERTNAWISRNRRLSKDFEFLPETEEAWVYLVMIRLMLGRLAS